MICTNFADGFDDVELSIRVTIMLSMCLKTLLALAILLKP